MSFKHVHGRKNDDGCIALIKAYMAADVIRDLRMHCSLDQHACIVCMCNIGLCIYMHL